MPVLSFQLAPWRRLGLLLLSTALGLGGCANAPRASDTVAPMAEQAASVTPSSLVSNPPSEPSPPRLETLPRAAIAAPPAPVPIDLTVPPEDLWQRIRNGFAMPDLHDPLVADRQSWYLNRPEMLRRIFERGRRYLYHIVGELEKRGMPTELALLPMVESAFNPQAVSRARAMGIWQFIPSTGKNYALDQNWWVDERRDIIASTEAALNYLQAVYEMHGDWHLALASYNWGEGAVARAIAKNQAKGLPTDYASLTMPAETRYYVPKLQALKNIIAQPELFGIHLPPIPNQPYFETVMKPERVDVAIAARLAGISVEEFLALNPAYHRPVIDGNKGGEELLLPVSKVGTFLANLARWEAEERPLSNWLTYAMKKGDTLARVAKRFAISEATLRQINGITPRVKVGPGFTLLVPRPGSQASAELIARALPPPAPEKPSATPSKRAVKPAVKAPPKAKLKAPAKPNKAALRPPAKPAAKKKR
ncbi:MAG: transglycosylase SLT domain-containing protein [Rhodocyclaceae bacterium]|nr:transglycosylase SLT domain-containing protein [Rhodocyclaceae bacterium]